jgi:hypothetical protein
MNGHRCQRGREVIDPVRWLWTTETDPEGCRKPASVTVCMTDYNLTDPGYAPDFSRHGVWEGVLKDIWKSLQDCDYWLCPSCHSEFLAFVKKRLEMRVGDEIGWLDRLYEKV